MESKSKQVSAPDDKVTQEEKITRKEAMIKAGKYAAITAVGMMLILSPKKSQAQSVVPPGGDPWSKM